LQNLTVRKVHFMHRSFLLPLALASFTIAQSIAVRPAWAQVSEPDQQSPVKPAVTPPRVRVNSAAEYPPQALRDGVTSEVTVVLVLNVNADGTVADATPETPQGHGFDEAAILAAKKLVFEPARRGDQPVAARIRFPYVFPPPRALLSGRVSEQGSATDAPIAGARVTLRGADGRARTVTTRADGTWQVTDLPAGAVSLTVEAPGYEPGTLAEEVRAGEETKLVVRLTSTSAAAKGATGDAADAPLEILVESERPPREVTRRTLTREEMMTMPGSLGDALRSLQDLPGVARPPPFSGLLIVRGSAPEDTNIFVDGVSVPLVYHFGGLSSVIPTELLEKIDFFPANYSTMYGRGLGGMVDVGIRDPKQDGRLHGFAQLDLIQLQLLLEGPIANTGWNFAVAGRRSWFDVWLGPALEETGASVTAAPRYYDYQVMAHRKIGADSSFRLLFFGSDDRLEILNQTPQQSTPQFGGQIGFKTTFWRLHARYAAQLADDTELRLTAGFGEDSFDFGVGENYFTLLLRPITVRTELSHSLMPSVKANVGLDIVHTPYEFTTRFPRIPRPGEPGGGPGDLPVESRGSGAYSTPAAYAELEVTPWRGGRIVPGLRADYSSDSETWDISPRVNVRQDLRSDFPRTTLKGAVGLFHQPPHPFYSDPVFGNPDVASSQAIHYDVGFEQEFTRQLELSTDVFYKDMDDLYFYGTGNTGEGRAYGVEWLFKYKPDDRFYGWVAYTLSRSEIREFPSYPLHLSQWDQTHIFTALGSYTLGRGWRIGAKVRYVTGTLYTPLSPGAYDATTGSMLSAPTFPPYGRRLPDFNQIDARVEKAWTFSAWKLTAYLDVLNVINRQNAEGVTYNYNYTQSKNVNGLPILPSIGVRGEF
jgi:TonB family protein